MRKDLQININTGDIVINSQNKIKLRPFSWVSNPQGLTRYIYGEIQIPGTISEASIKNDGIYLAIPYTPQYKEFYIRIKRVFSDETNSFVQNPVDGSDWFLVRTGLYSGKVENAYASRLYMVSEDNYYIKLNKGYADIYSGNESDVNIVSAQHQNTKLLLKCLPTNNYRYPLAGVGLIRWINGNIHNTELSSLLKREFESDGMTVKSASFDFDTKNLHLDLEPYNSEENGTA